MTGLNHSMYSVIVLPNFVLNSFLGLIDWILNRLLQNLMNHLYSYLDEQLTG